MVGVDVIVALEVMVDVSVGVRVMVVVGVDVLAAVAVFVEMCVLVCVGLVVTLLVMDTGKTSEVLVSEAVGVEKVKYTSRKSAADPESQQSQSN
jgi:hypothetical protein